jgi:sacsin
MDISCRRVKMGLQPIAHNAQVQRLTTALKNICRDYPAGGTVLRELLQNADDAGATVVVRNL